MFARAQPNPWEDGTLPRITRKGNPTRLVMESKNGGVWLAEEGEGKAEEPAYIRTKDPALFLALNPAEIGELVSLLDMAETILAVEAGSA